MVKFNNLNNIIIKYNIIQIIINICYNMNVFLIGKLMENIKKSIIIIFLGGTI